MNNYNDIHIMSLSKCFPWQSWGVDLYDLILIYVLYPKATLIVVEQFNADRHLPLDPH